MDRQVTPLDGAVKRKTSAEKRELAMARGESWEEVHSKGKEMDPENLKVKLLFSFLELKKKEMEGGKGQGREKAQRRIGVCQRGREERKGRRQRLYVGLNRTHLLLLHGQHKSKRCEVEGQSLRMF